jgi:hypothetical protein
MLSGPVKTERCTRPGLRQKPAGRIQFVARADLMGGGHIERLDSARASFWGLAPNLRKGVALGSVSGEHLLDWLSVHHDIRQKRLLAYTLAMSKRRYAGPLTRSAKLSVATAF